MPFGSFVPVMLDVLRHEIRAIDTSRKALRSFGISVGIVCLLISLLVAWRGNWVIGWLPSVLAGIGGALVFGALLVPIVLKPLHIAWMTLALVLGYVMTRVLLTAVFYLVVTPTGLVMRVLGKDPLQRRIDHDASTYWIPKSYEDPSPDRLEKYY